MILKIVWIILLITIMPLLVGNSLLMCCKLKKTVKFRYAFGWLFLLAIFEITVVPTTFGGGSLGNLCWIYSLIVLAVVLSLTVWKRKSNVAVKWKKIQWDLKKISGYGVVSVILLMLQLVVAILAVHMDADDAYYIGTANTSVVTDTLFAVEPDTGMPYQTIPLRYAFSSITIFWAYLSKLTGIHPLIIAHSIIPVIFILISYLLWWEVGMHLFDSSDKKWLFFLFINLLNIFGNTSVYTQSSFLLFRIWQGKAMLPNIILPAFLATFLSIYEAPNKKTNWLIIFIIIVAGCCCSSMAVPLCTMVVAAASIVLAIKLRNWKTLIYGVVCCIPCLGIGLAYMVLQ